MDTDAVCVRCGAALVTDARAERFIERRPGRPEILHAPGASLDLLYRLRGRSARILYAALAPFRAPLPRDIEDRKPYRAAFLALIPGAGQLYNHQLAKALVFMPVWAALLVAAGMTYREPYSNRVLLALFLWAVYAFHDGYRTARRINGDPWYLRLSLAFYTAWIFIFCASCILAQFLLGPYVVKFRHMSEPALTPVIDLGDRFVVDRFSYLFRGPRVGEIVYYKPRQIALDAGENLYIEAPLNGIERVVALPGETFSRRQGRYFRNGRPVPEAEGPINRTEVRWDYQLEAPEDRWIVIRSYTSADAFGAGAPRMYEVLDVQGWEEACFVSEDDLIGRAILVYHPPERRRFLTPAAQASRAGAEP
jgi:signal peptidase I